VSEVRRVDEEKFSGSKKRVGCTAHVQNGKPFERQVRNPCGFGACLFLHNLDFRTTTMVLLKPVVLGIHLNPLAFVSLSGFYEVTDSLTFTWSISALVRPVAST
jgi:hypothetical protein